MTKKQVTEDSFKDIRSAIDAWGKRSTGAVFVGAFISFNEKDDTIKDDMIAAFGCKKNLIPLLDELRKVVKESKDHFVNL